MTKIKVNGIELKVLASAGFTTKEEGQPNQVWTAAGSYLSNKHSVKNSYSFECGPYTEEEISFIEELINGRHDYFPMRDGFESTTGLQPLSNYNNYLTSSGGQISNSLRYDLQLTKGSRVYFKELHGVSVYDYDTDEVITNTPTIFDVYTMGGIFTIHNTIGFPDPLDFMIRTYSAIPESLFPSDFSSWGDSPYVNVSGALVNNKEVKCLGRAGVVTPVTKTLRKISMELYEVDNKYTRTR